MKENKKRLAGLLGGLLIALIIWNLPLSMEQDGIRCLALSLMAVVWWAAKVMNSGYVSPALLASYVLFLSPETVPGHVIFSAWISPVMYLVISGFLIAEAVQASGLGERIAGIFARHCIHSYTGLIVSCYALGVLLSILIPHPWPRSFLIWSVMEPIVSRSGLEKKYADNVKFAVFVSSIPTSMVLLTGDSTLNPVIADFAGVSLSFMTWIKWMAVPGMITCALTCGLQLLLFGRPEEFHLELNPVTDASPWSFRELACIGILSLAVVGQFTDSIHGIHPAWIAVAAVLLFALPGVGLLNEKSFKSVNVGTLLFLSAALSIGNVGRATGMNAWIAQTFLPESISSNVFVFALVTCAVCMVIHMLLGSTLAVPGIAVPAMVAFGMGVGVPSLAASLIGYMAVASHWLFPFHHMNLLVGCGSEGGLNEKNVVKMGAFQTGVVLIAVLLAVGWWKLTGLI